MSDTTGVTAEELQLMLARLETENAALRESYASPCGKQGHLSSAAGRTPGDGETVFCATCEEIAAAERKGDGEGAGDRGG